MHYDLLIRHATVIDGSACPAYLADVAVQNGRIAAIEASPEASGDAGADRKAGMTAHTTVDAAGRVLAPGFIDVHTHDDRALLTPGAMLSKLSQGVTTVVTGNCGLSLAPTAPNGRIPAPLDLIATPEWLRFPAFRDYIEALESTGIAVNAVCLVGHLTLRAHVMSELERTATDAECAQMRQLLADALDAGAYGMSTGTFYPPARHASTDEIVAVAAPLTAHRALYATHMRNEAEKVIEALDETFDIGRRLDVRVLISHHKLAGVANHGRSVETLERIAAAMEKQPVSLDCYPYNASSTTLRPEFVARASSILVTWSEALPEHAGRVLSEIAADLGCTDEEAAARLMPAGAIYFMMDEADVRRILAFEKTMVGSDGMPHDEHPHPRLWGTFPRVLGYYARDEKLFSLETAISKMSGLTAAELGLHGRGKIALGQAADMVLLDPASVNDRATFDHPRTLSSGIDSVWVNGQLAFQAGAVLNDKAGQVLRRQRAG